MTQVRRICDKFITLFDRGWDKRAVVGKRQVGRRLGCKLTMRKGSSSAWAHGRARPRDPGIRRKPLSARSHQGSFKLIECFHSCSWDHTESSGVDVSVVLSGENFSSTSRKCCYERSLSSLVCPTPLTLIFTLGTCNSFLRTDSSSTLMI